MIRCTLSRLPPCIKGNLLFSALAVVRQKSANSTARALMAAARAPGARRGADWRRLSTTPMYDMRGSHGLTLAMANRYKGRPVLVVLGAGSGAACWQRASWPSAGRAASRVYNGIITAYT
ncbi:unnamed protein product, partial [Brenthis ino]